MLPRPQVTKALSQRDRKTLGLNSRHPSNKISAAVPKCILPLVA